MRTINIRCTWNDLDEIQRQLCNSLRNIVNRSQWKNLSFEITRYGSSLHFSVQATSEERHESALQSPTPILEVLLKDNSQPSSERQKQVGPPPPPTLRLEKIDSKEVIPEPCTNKTTVEQKPPFNISTKNVQQKMNCDAAIQTEFVTDSELREMDGFSIVIFGPYELIADRKRFVKCVQVGKGYI